MAEAGLLGVALVIVLGTAAQALAYRLRMPSIVLLLLLGFLAGPVTGLLRPDEALGDLLLPLVSAGVAVVLFEGGLGLDIRVLAGQRKVVARLVTVGVVVTWLVGAGALVWLFGFSVRAALLLGAILVVSGPTVVGPLLRTIQPSRSLDAVVRWEGIVVDPVGALLAVAVFDTAYGGGSAAATLTEGLIGLGASIAVGALVGVVAALAFVALEARYWVPDHLASATALALVLGAFTAAEVARPESGLFAVTLMGIALANQRRVSVHHIIDFKESLSLILLGALFILLAARVRMDDILGLDWRAAALIGVLILVARPLAVAASTFGSKQPWRERLFLGALSPRGIVAAAVASLFAIRLDEIGAPEADLFVPLTFSVIVATVIVSSLGARPLARKLKVAQPDPQGVLFIGANVVSRRLAKVLQEEGQRAVIVGTDREAVQAARLEGLEAHRDDVLSLHLTEDLDLGGIGRLWAMTADDEVNSLAAVHFRSHFSRAHTYQVATQEEEEIDRHEHLRGRILFAADLTYRRLRDRLASDQWTIRRTPITERFSVDDHRRQYGEDAVPLFLIGPARMRIFTTDHRPEPHPGQTLVALVRRAPPDAKPREEEE